MSSSEPGVQMVDRSKLEDQQLKNFCHWITWTFRGGGWHIFQCSTATALQLWEGIIVIISVSLTTPAQQCAGISNTRLRSTWLIVLRQPQTSRDYALPVVTNFLCHVTNSAHLVVGPLLSLDQRLGIRCQLTSVIRRVVTSLSDVHWKQFCSLSTSVSSALEVFLRRCAI